MQIVQHVRELVSVAPLLGVEGDQEVDRGGAVVSGTLSRYRIGGPPSTGTSPTVSVMTASCGPIQSSKPGAAAPGDRPER